MAWSSLDCRELDMTTDAPLSRAASATQNPMPEVPPKTKTLLLVSLEAYLDVVVMVEERVFTFCNMVLAS